MDRGYSVKRKIHPRETTNIVSLLSFFYMIQLFKKGYTKGLENEDLYEVLRSSRSKELGDRLQKHWQNEESRTKPSICRATWKCFGRTFLTLGLMQFIMKIIMTIWSPQALSKLISYFSPGQHDVTYKEAIYYACVVIGLKVVNLFFSHNYSLVVSQLGLSVKAAVSSLLYRKSLKLNCESLSQITVGKITTVINKDVDSFEHFISFGNEIWIALVQTGIICGLIFNKIGVASWAGIAFFFVILPVQMFIGKMAYHLRLKCSKKTDERLQLTQEVLSAIKIIKMYTWEKYFENKIYAARKEELSELHKLFYTKIWIMVIGTLSSKVAFFIFLMTYASMDISVTAETVYYILSCFNDLQSALCMTIPFGFSQAAELYATANRCEGVLTCQELPPKPEINTSKQPQIIFKTVSAKICGHNVLENVSLIINTGLNILVGHVGSGKSTFLKAIIGDCQVTGDVNISGSISYASQEPWLFPSTIKNNILFGEEYCEKRYKEVLKICCLDFDLHLLPEGDSTIVGDRGINLSKGQQARVNLARAVYRKSDIYLLDDSLASLDAHVSDHIFDKCICKFLKDKLCIFVTNNFHHIQKANEAFVIKHRSIECTKVIDRNLSHDYVDSDINQKDEPTLESVDQSQVFREVKNPGKVSLGVYHRYVLYGGGIIVFCIVLALMTITQFTSSYSDKLMSNWVTLEQNVTNLKLINQSTSVEFEDLYIEKTSTLTLFSTIFLISTFLTLISTFAFFYFVKRASINMHQALLKSIMNSTMKFFDSNFIGNVLTRFSKDFVTADEYLAFILAECLMIVFIAVGGIILLTTVNLIFLLEALILLIIAYMLKKFCQPTGRNLQRLHVMARSPMIGHVYSTLTGLATIRASNAEEIVAHEFDRHQNVFTSANYMLNNSLIALAYSLDLFSVVFAALVIIQFLVVDSDTNVGDVGLAITQSFTVTSIIANGIRCVSDCENLMTSVERIMEYIAIEQEDETGKEVKDWPQSGSIIFNQVSLSYGEASKEMLHDISVEMKAKEKIGIVGRTGAGKSSIISSLLRLYQPKGKITIDGMDTKEVSLRCLRTNISVIPQDPFLFSGTIRDNLDPLRQYPDEKIWRVLSDLRLKNLVDDLDRKVDEGSSFSAGQKQLLCLARVILRRNKIVVLDEATANVDHETDALIHETVLNNFVECTVIIIAHRLLSVMDCHRVVVLNDGRITEFDEPKRLLQNKSSFFYSVIK